MFRNGTSFTGNMVIPDFDIENNDDIRTVEELIKEECNKQSDDDSTKVEFVSLINWKAL